MCTSCWARRRARARHALCSQPGLLNIGIALALALENANVKCIDHCFKPALDQLTLAFECFGKFTHWHLNVLQAI